MSNGPTAEAMGSTTSDNKMINKKVLLRERKRHTARRVASDCYAEPSGGGYPISGLGGYPIPGPGGTLSQVRGGYPISGLGGTPSQVRGEYPIPGPGVTPSQVQGGIPSKVWGEGVPQVPPQSDLGWGTPLPRLGTGYPPKSLTDTHL